MFKIGDQVTVNPFADFAYYYEAEQCMELAEKGIVGTVMEYDHDAPYHLFWRVYFPGYLNLRWWGTSELDLANRK